MMGDRALLEAVCARLRQGSRAVLCTVAAAEGSAPRGPGARMAVFAEDSVGTVGGGRVELLVRREAEALLKRGGGCVRTYGLENGGDAGAVCGGAVTLLLVCLEAEALPQLERWAQVLDRGAEAAVRLDVRGISVEEGAAAAGGAVGGGVGAEGIRPGETLYLVGGGHVGAALAPLLARLDFRVVVFDQRPELARPERFPGAARVVLGDFGRIADFVNITRADYVVVMTPGHEADLAVLRQVLPCEPAYVGCMGSRKKLAFVRRNLEADGCPQAQIQALHLPIGLEIGAETPLEIAVSVASELVACRAAIRGGRKGGACPA